YLVDHPQEEEAREDARDEDGERRVHAEERLAANDVQIGEERERPECGERGVELRLEDVVRERFEAAEEAQIVERRDDGGAHSAAWTTEERTCSRATCAGAWSTGERTCSRATCAGAWSTGEPSSRIVTIP